MARFIKIKDLFKTYRSGFRPALDGVSLDIEAGEVMGLLGVNGAGKTTLSSILAGLLAPSSGDIFFEGKSIYTNLPAYRKNVGLCPQKPNLSRELDLRENLFYSALAFGLTSKEAKGAVAKISEQFGLSEYLESNAAILSGGWRQRFLIARALVHSPKIVILDEPTVGLDPHIRHQLWDVILELKALGVTVILTTHYLDEAEKLCDRVCVVDRGQIKTIETPANLKKSFKKGNLEEVFLELIREEREVS